MSQGQIKAIRAFLEDGRCLSAMDALKRFSCFRLAARIWELRDSGVPITTTVVTTRSGKRIAVYRLGEPNVRRFKCR